MNIQNVKTLAWAAAIAVGGGLGWTVYDFLHHRAELEQVVGEASRQAVLSNEAVGEAPHPVASTVSYDAVKGVFVDMNWTGKEPPAPPPPKASETPQAKTVKPVSDLLVVLFVQVDSDDQDSLAYVKYLDTQLAVTEKTNEDLTLRVGEHLASPYTDVKVDAITVDGVRFTFDDASRAAEVVPPQAFPEGGASQIVKVGPDGLILPEGHISIPRIEARWNPAQMTVIGRNEYRIGTEDVQNMQKDYSRILSQDVNYTAHRDPRTGQVDGLQVTHVAPGSIAERAGLSEGEVLKSINGHRVTSMNQAISYVKKEAETTNTWLAVFEKQGREYTRTYYSPEQ